MTNIKCTILARTYDWLADENGKDDPIEVLAEYDNQSMVKHMAEHTVGGVTICGHGSGEVWLEWETVPILIEMLQRALADKP